MKMELYIRVNLVKILNMGLAKRNMNRGRSTWVLLREEVVVRASCTIRRALRSI